MYRNLGKEQHHDEKAVSLGLKLPLPNLGSSFT
jgi:hypothetical protein